MTDYTPWTRRHTGGPRGIAALMTGVSYWLLWTLVIVAAGHGLPWQTLAWWSAVAAFASAVVVVPLANVGLKRCYPRPAPEPGENVRKDRPGMTRISGNRRLQQTGPTSFRVIEDLPIPAHILEDWIKDVKAEKASWNVHDGRKRGLNGEQVKEVKEWLAKDGVALIDLYGPSHWNWTDRGRDLCRALERGYSLDWVIDNPPPAGIDTYDGEQGVE